MNEWMNLPMYLQFLIWRVLLENVSFFFFLYNSKLFLIAGYCYSFFLFLLIGWLPNCPLTSLAQVCHIESVKSYWFCQVKNQFFEGQVYTILCQPSHFLMLLSVFRLYSCTSQVYLACDLCVLRLEILSIF